MRGADQSSDGSPFAELLAATLQQASAQQVPELQPSTQQTSAQQPSAQQVQAGTAANDDNISAANDADAQTNGLQAISQSISQSIPQSGSKNDRGTGVDAQETGQKSGAEKDKTVDTAIVQPVLAAQLPLVAPAILSVSQNNAQATAAVSNDDDTVANPSSAIAPNAQNDGPAQTSPPPTSQTVGNAEIATPNLVLATADPSQTAQDRSENSSGTVTDKSGKPAAPVNAGDGKPVASKLNDSKPIQPTDPPTSVQTLMAIDGLAAPNMTPVPAAGNTGAIGATIQTAQNGTITNLSAAPIAKDTAPADRPAQTNSQPSAFLPPASLDFAATLAAGNKDAGQSISPLQAALTATGDAKPVHASAADAAPQSQIDIPAVAVHAAAETPAPQSGVGAVTLANPGLQPAASNATVAISVHIAAANSDPTPNLDAMAVSIAARALSGAKQFEIRLDPPELGRVDVRLSIDASGKTQAHMTADQPQTLDLLQKDAPNLTQALRDAGLDVSQSGLNFSLRGQDRQNGDGNDNTGQGRRTDLTASQTIQATQSPAAISFNGAAADARVDIHV